MAVPSVFDVLTDAELLACAFDTVLALLRAGDVTAQAAWQLAVDDARAVHVLERALIYGSAPLA